MIVFLAIAMAPFQAPDEDNHALRAEQISLGVPFLRGGGMVNSDLARFKHLFEDLHFHFERKQTAEMSRAAAALKWTAPNQEAGFQNTAQYGPLLYLPQVIGIWIGKLCGLDVVWTILLARLINGFTAASIGFAAIRICRRGQAMVFTTLLLPMTLSQFASVSQDALIISLSIFAVALGSRIIAEQRPARAGEFAWFAFIVVVTTMARPSQIALAAMVPVFAGRRDETWPRKLAIAILALAALGWWLAILPSLMPNIGYDVSIHDQLVAMAVHPWLLPELIVNSLRQGGFWLFTSLVGRMGWLDTPMPDWYYNLAIAILALALLAPGNTRPRIAPALIGVVAVVLMLASVSATLYASWTAVGKITIDGMQGRYVLPVLPLLGWAAPVYTKPLARFFSPAWWAVVVFPVVTAWVLPGAIMQRFYGSWSGMSDVLKLMYLN